MSTIAREEFAGAINGVPGRFHRVILWPADASSVPERCRGLIANQKWTSAAREFTTKYGKERLQVEMRFDDGCKNGHESFAITATGWTRSANGRWVEDRGGCLHEEIALRFPELAPLIQWHLCSTDGPMHYVANTVYRAGDRDHNGKRKGEPWAWQEAIRFGDNPIMHNLAGAFWKFLKEHSPLAGGRAFDFEVIRVDHKDRGKLGAYQHGPRFTFGGYAQEWHECPFDSEDEALRFLGALNTCSPVFEKVPYLWGEGKERELDAARRTAIWPEATDAELSVEPDALKAALEARLPALLMRFNEAMAGAGFVMPDVKVEVL